MPYTVTTVSTKPAGTQWWNAVEGSANDLARKELFAWMAQQPGYLGIQDPPPGPQSDVSSVVLIFDTQENYTAYHQAMVLQPAAQTRAAYNLAQGITSEVTGVAT